jgi:hypothetical protein
VTNTFCLAEVWEEEPLEKKYIYMFFFNLQNAGVFQILKGTKACRVVGNSC